MSVRDPVVTERWALAVLRVSVGVFLLLWGVEKFVIPTTTVRIWDKFYGIGLGASLVPMVGAVESALALAIVVGLWRRVSYGLGLLVTTVSVLSSWRQLTDPWGLPLRRISESPVSRRPARPGRPPRPVPPHRPRPPHPPCSAPPHRQPP